ncbi:MAG TPA: hypothetical protein VE152_07500 [Acidimicrobiales bacterium]|nr:hypothetical protein [Acidimicrobiales bacterium]
MAEAWRQEVAELCERAEVGVPPLRVSKRLPATASAVRSGELVLPVSVLVTSEEIRRGVVAHAVARWALGRGGRTSEAVVAGGAVWTALGVALVTALGVSIVAAAVVGAGAVVAAVGAASVFRHRARHGERVDAFACELVSVEEWAAGFLWRTHQARLRLPRLPRGLARVRGSAARSRLDALGHAVVKAGRGVRSALAVRSRRVRGRYRPLQRQGDWAPRR